LHGHSAKIKVVPLFGSIVVKGRGEILTSISVAAEKKVDFPEDGFPTIPKNMNF
jgi:hypothetical protein